MRRKALSGQGRPVNAGPSEQRWSEGTRRSAPGRIEGQALLVIFVGAGHPATGKSNSPGRAKPSTSKQLSSEPGPQTTRPEKRKAGSSRHAANPAYETLQNSSAKEKREWPAQATPTLRRGTTCPAFWARKRVQLTRRKDAKFTTSPR